MSDLNLIDGQSSGLPEARRRVHFSDVDVLATYYDETSSMSHEDLVPHPLLSVPQKAWKFRERRSQASLETVFRGRYLSIQPADELVFENRSKDQESSDVIRLVNVTSSYVAFKIKTTAPEKFRVKPSFGCIESGGSKIVDVSILQGFLMTAQKDRFLVMSVPLESEPPSAEDLVDHWHELLKDGTVGSNVDEHKLKCTITELPVPEVVTDTKKPVTNVSLLLEKLDSIDSKLDFILLARKERTVQQSKMRWNLLTVALGLVLLLLSARIVSAIIGPGTQNLLSTS